MDLRSPTVSCQCIAQDVAGSSERPTRAFSKGVQVAHEGAQLVFEGDGSHPPESVLLPCLARSDKSGPGICR